MFIKNMIVKFCLYGMHVRGGFCWFVVKICLSDWPPDRVHCCDRTTGPSPRTGRKFWGVFNFAFFVGGCRTRKLKPAKGFVYACEIVTHPNSTKFTTREIFQIRQNIELHENLHPQNFLPVRYYYIIIDNASYYSTHDCIIRKKDTHAIL